MAESNKTHCQNCAEKLISSNSCSLTTEWLTTKEAADYLKIPVGSLRNMTSNGQVPYFKLGNRNRYSLTELRKLLLGQKGVFYGN